MSKKTDDDTSESEQDTVLKLKIHIKPIIQQEFPSSRRLAIRAGLTIRVIVL